MKNQLIVVIIVFLSACKTNTPGENDTDKAESPDVVQLTNAQVKNSDVQLGILQRKDVSAILRVTGKIDVPPQNMVSVSVPMGGYLKTTNLLEGMHVRKGEVIATMEDQQYIQLQQDYLTAKAQYSYMDKEYSRQKDLNESKASSDKVFENAQAGYTSQKVLVKSLSEKLKLIGINADNLNEDNISRSINIYSPIDGYVTSVKQNIGKYVAPTDVVFELVSPADIHLALTVFEKDLDKLFIGQKVVAYNNSQPEKKYACEVILIGQELSPERAVTVHCHFEQYDKSLIPGMYMNAEVRVITNNAFVIPNDGLVRFEGKQYVFMETGDQKFKMREVSTQHAEHDYTQINFADTMNVSRTRFVLKGAYTLLMKMKNVPEE